MITKHCIEDLSELHNLLNVISEMDYSCKIPILSNTSMGEHIRHILEFYGCVLFNKNPYCIDYDMRQRSKELENEPTKALEYIDKLFIMLLKGFPDQEQKLVIDLSLTGDELANFGTSIYRELAYCLEHSVHHKALIKIGLLATGNERLVTEDFGVAASTKRNKMISKKNRTKTNQLKNLSKNYK